MSAQDLHGQIAIVTGAGSGIGRAMAVALAQAGANIVLAARTKPKLDDLATELAKSGGSALVVPTDVGDESQVETLISKTTSAYGHLDVLVTSAGSAVFGPLTESRTEDWDTMININLRGTYLCCKHAVRAMSPRGRGHILNVLSIASTHILPGSTGYTASKFGALGLTKVIAAEVRSLGIKVTAVIPGAVDTPLWDNSGSTLDRSKMLSSTDVANAMLSVITQPSSIYTDEIVLMPPLGVL